MDNNSLMTIETIEQLNKQCCRLVPEVEYTPAVLLTADDFEEDE